MRARRRIVTDKLHEVYVVFPIGDTDEAKFKKSKKYKEIVAYVKSNNLILNSEYFQETGFVVGEDDPEDYMEDPTYYRFSFLVKKDAKMVSKEFGLKMLTTDFEGECWWYWPDDNDPGDPGDSNMPDRMSFDECMEIYGDIPGNRD
jgi:hypothetical protein